MKVGAHEITPHIRISFDNEKGTLHVNELKSLIPGFHGKWCEIATFTTKTNWYESIFSKMVTSDYLENMILWFWIDLKETC